MNRLRNNMISNAAFLGISACLTLTSTSCGEIEELSGKRYENSTVRDISESQRGLHQIIDANAYSESLLELSGISSGELTSSGVRLYFTAIGAKYIPQTSVVSLEAKNWLISPQGPRLEEIDAFIAGAHENAEALFGISPEDQKSNLYFGIVSTLKEMDHSADVRLCTVYSDLLEVSVIANFEQYKDRPLDLMKDYSVLRDKFLEAEPLSGAYSGLQMVLIVPGDDQLIYEASKFWSRFFGEVGISVDVRAAF